MANSRKSAQAESKALIKAPTGIRGLDEITGGGLPTGRPTLVCGGPGCGKTLLAMEFLVRGAMQFNEPGVFMAFEETEDDLTRNVRTLGFKLSDLVGRKKLALDYVRIERSEIAETGEYDLEGLFIRLGQAVKSIGARRVALDTIEALFSGLANEAVLRAELRRLFSWLKQNNLTAIITGERGQGTLTRYGLEEYVADCVILLDHRVSDQVSTRRLRIVKYRGSEHGTNEYPFLIGKTGLSVFPITSLSLNHKISRGRVSSGVPRLDAMLGGKGYFRGSSVLISGTAGTGKTSLAAAFTAAACRRGERCLYFAFEESQDQILRNVRSIGIDLGGYVKQRLLQFHAARPTVWGLEMHLVAMHDYAEQFRPRHIVLDPVTNLVNAGNMQHVLSMLTRLIDFFKMKGITVIFTSLTTESTTTDTSEVGISSLMDTWVLLRNLEYSGERNRALYILKSRGMAHSNQVREFRLSAKGIELIDVYLGGDTVLTGSARMLQEARDRAQAHARQLEITRLQREMERKKREVENQIAALRGGLEEELHNLNQAIRQENLQRVALERDRTDMARRRMADDRIDPGATVVVHRENNT